MFKLVLEKAEEPEIKLPTSIGSSKKQENSRKISTSALSTTPKPWTVWITKLENSSRDENTRSPDLPPEKSVCQGCILSLCLFNLHAEYIMQNAGLDEAQLESILPGEILITSDMQMTSPLWQTVKMN